MLPIYACALIVCAASLLAGRAILALLGRRRPAWLSGATGFAALVVAAPLLIRLPGRATTAAIVLGLALIAAATVAWRDLRRVGDAHLWPLGAAVGALVIAATTLPFLISDRVGILGEGVYTNDHAAQLYWADWLQHGFGPEPSAVRFGYPVGPQAVAVIAAQVTGASLVDAFNGLLLAIPTLTGLTALGALAGFPPVRRIAIAALTGLPYLAASFLAQSAFKETAMALFCLAFALALQSAMPVGDAAGRPPWRSVVAVCLLLAAASVFTFSAPGLAWFALAVPLWLGLELIAGRSPVDWGAVRDGLAAHKLTLAVAVVILIAIAAVAFTPAREFADKIADVQVSVGRLSSPVFPGEVFGIWPAGDFRIVRGEVSGALPAAAIGALAAGYGAFQLWRRRRLALLAMLIAGAAVYVLARLFAEIHVEAKALAVIAPVVILVSLWALLEPRTSNEQRATSILRYAAGALVFTAATLPPCWLCATPRSASTTARPGSSASPSRSTARRSPSSASIVSPATTCAARSPARPPATCRRRSPRAPTRGGRRAWRPTSTPSTRASSTSSAMRSRPRPPTAPPRRPTSSRSSSPATTCSGGGRGRPRGPSCYRGRAAPRPAPLPSTRARPSSARPAVRSEAARRWCFPEPALAVYERWDQPAPPDAKVAGQGLGWQAPGEATISLDLPRPAATRSRCSTTRRCRSRWSMRAR